MKLCQQKFTTKICQIPKAATIMPRNQNHTLIITVLIFLYSLHFVSCQTNKQNEGKNYRPPAIDLVAWNEDTIKSIKLGFAKSNTFYYSISDRAQTGIVKYLYKGTWARLGDTLILKYKNNKKPDSFKPFLILETTGHYLIQEIEPNKN